jgi:glycosyltransferase involved in cell wall biosynthesis
MPEGARDLDGTTYFLSVASQEPRKNVERLVQAYVTLPVYTRREHPLLLVGGTHAAFADVDQSQDAEGLRRLGYVDDADLAELYSRDAVLVSISLDEGFGMPIIESAQGGARLLLSDIEVYRWLAGDDAIFVDPLDVAAVAQGLLDALDRPWTPRRTATLDRFNWSATAGSMASLMAELAEEPVG